MNTPEPHFIDRNTDKRIEGPTDVTPSCTEKPDHETRKGEVWRQETRKGEV